MKFTNAIKRLEKKGYEIELQYDHSVAIASMDDKREIEVTKNGREDLVASIMVGGISFPNTLKRAMELSDNKR